jgi:acyl-CoA synthetase (NDP forming)
MDTPALDYLFHPNSIAIAGVSPNPSSPNLAQSFMLALKEFGFKGELYSIHQEGGELFGMTVYPNVKDIPGPVDYVISAIPARFTPKLIEDCGEKGVKAVHLFSAGYSEIEDEMGSRLEELVLRIARKSGVRIIGPNCMGIYCPSGGLTFIAEYPEQSGFSRKSGNLGLISQSGGNATYCVREASSRGIFFSKVISYGNAADLNESDYLEYMAEDPNTKVIAMYIEGVRDGPRFVKALRKAAASKPVIVNKAGNTASGARVCVSHTSAIAGSERIWTALIKQAGAVQVTSMSELIDVSLAFLKLPVPKGKRTVVIGAGGGIGVQSADDVINAGLQLPELSTSLRRTIHSIYGSEAGRIFGNPIDIPPLGKAELHVAAAKSIADSNQTDIIMLHFPFDFWGLTPREKPLEQFIGMTTEILRTVKKPIAVVLHYAATTGARKAQDEMQCKLAEMGVPVYPSISRAASAINKLIDYYNNRL